MCCQIAISPGKDSRQSFGSQRTKITGRFGRATQSTGQQHRSLNLITNRGRFGGLGTVFDGQNQQIGAQRGHQCIAGQNEQQANDGQTRPGREGGHGQ